MCDWRKYVVWNCLVRNGTLMNPFVPTSQNIIYIDLLNIIIRYACAARDEICNESGILFLC